MRLTLTVCRQHLGRMFKKHWKIQGQKPILDTGAEKELSKLGISVQQAEDVLREKIKKEKIEIIGFEGNQPPKIEHVPRHENTCYVYRDHNVLLEGLEQAKLLTKTVEIQNSFPEALQNPPANDHLPDLDELVQRYVLTSHVFNATQEFLPRIHDPVRPAFNFPRVMGIPDSRSSSLLYMKFLHLSEAIMGKSLGMSSVNDSFFAVPLEKDGNTLQFEVTADLLLTSSRYLSPIADREAVKEAQNIPLPDLHPIMPVISLEKEEAYEIKDLYPVDVDGDFPSIHTAVVFYDKEKVQNLFATPVTETQILGRSLMHSFTMASAQARQTFGIADEDLPSPVTIQCIQTDGKLFYFSLFQLNTLNLNGVEGTRNLFWMLPAMSLFDKCCYDQGVPVLEGYNPEVFRTFLGFCSNGQHR